MRRLLRIARATLAGAAVFLLATAAAARGQVAAPASAPPPAAPAATAPDAAPQADTALQFVRDGRVVSTLDLAAIRRVCHEQTVAIDDPYYGRRKSFRACPLAEVLQAGFGASPDTLRGDEFLLRARDGYTKPSTGAQLLEPSGFLAFADAERTPPDGPPVWEPIDRRQADPGPYYLVWELSGDADPHRYPWPYQLARIEIASLASEYPHLVPTTASAGSPAQRGFEIFKSDCVACHALNGEGGRVGPDLNVPQSIVEYRPREQIKAYVRDPQTFRYTTMPSHAYLTDADLDALIAYFDAMSRLKHDPGKAS
jgi:mono/diheme cytochrome c family protein